MIVGHDAPREPQLTPGSLLIIPPAVVAGGSFVLLVERILESSMGFSVRMRSAE
jgi:hypothetical protein